MAHRKWILAAAFALFAVPALAAAGRPSRDQIAADRAAAFSQADADGDGTLSPAEFETFQQLMKAKMTQNRFAHADANGDGKVTLEELAAAHASHGCHADGRAAKK